MQLSSVRWGKEKDNKGDALYYVRIVKLNNGINLIIHYKDKNTKCEEEEGKEKEGKAVEITQLVSQRGMAE